MAWEALRRAGALRSKMTLACMVISLEQTLANGLIDEWDRVELHLSVYDNICGEMGLSRKAFLSVFFFFDV